ncbi:pilus assembly protein TadG-related protein [Methylocystis sp. S23]
MRQTSKIARFAKNEKGGVAVVMGLTIVPLVLASGLAADYAILQTAKARLDASADAAALTAIKTAQNTIATLSATNRNPKPQAISDALAQAEKSFYAQAGKRASDLLGKPTFDVTIDGQNVTATVAYNAAMPSNFGKIAGIKLMNYSGSAGAQLTMAKFLDFYMLIDVSASMGLPSTIAGQNQLAAASPDGKQDNGDGCMFACHFSGKNSYDYARAHNIQLRVDAVGAAIAQLMKTANDTATLPKQFRMGVYPFVTHANAFVDLTDDLIGDQYSVASAINYNPATQMTDFGKLLDGGDDKIFARSLNPNYRANPKIPADTAPLGAGGSHIHTVFDDISAKIPAVGDGSGASKGQPFVFFVSDGMEDSQWYSSSQVASPTYPYAPTNWPGVTLYPNTHGETVSIRAMDPTKCAALKARGVTISVLQIPYPTFPHPTSYAQWEALKVNNAVPGVDAAMQACASPGFYHKADGPADIAAAMQDMFRQAVQSARLTQ